MKRIPIEHLCDAMTLSTLSGSDLSVAIGRHPSYFAATINNAYDFNLAEKELRTIEGLLDTDLIDPKAQAERLDLIYALSWIKKGDIAYVIDYLDLTRHQVAKVMGISKYTLASYFRDDGVFPLARIKVFMDHYNAWPLVPKRREKTKIKKNPPMIVFGKFKGKHAIKTDTEVMAFIGGKP